MMTIGRRASAATASAANIVSSTAGRPGERRSTPVVSSANANRAANDGRKLVRTTTLKKVRARPVPASATSADVRRDRRSATAAVARALVRTRSRICRSDARFSRNADVRTAGYHDVRPMTNTKPPEHDEVTLDDRVELLVGRPQEEIA